MTKPILHAACAALLLASFGVVAGAADAVPTPKPTDSTQASRDPWEQVLATLEARNRETSLAVLKRFEGRKDAAPYQKAFAACALRLLTEPAKPSVAPELPGVTANNSRIQALRTRIEKEEEKRPFLNQQIADASKVGPVGRFVEWLTGLGDHGRGSEWGKALAERGLKEVEANITAAKAEIAALEKANVQLQQAAADKAAKEQAAFREKSVSFLREQMEARRSRAAMALATLWVDTKGADAEITSLLQAAGAMLKAERDALATAAPAIQAANDLLAKGRLWDARARIAKVLEDASTRSKDPLAMEFLRREVFPASTRIEGELAKALKQREAFMELATRDGADAARKLEEFRKAFPDYPGYDQDKRTIGELRVPQVEKRFARDFAAIEERIPRDPSRARAMIKPLFARELDPEETAILKSLVAKVNLKIAQQEADLVRKDFDEVYAVLSEFDTAFAEKLKTGAPAQVGLVRLIASGVGPLLRARGLQEKSLHRLDVLLAEEMDATTKSPLMQMLGKETASLKQMDDTLAESRRSKTVAIVMGSVLLFGMVGVGGFAVWKRRKGNAPVKSEGDVGKAGV